MSLYFCAGGYEFEEDSCHVISGCPGSNLLYDGFTSQVAHRRSVALCQTRHVKCHDIEHVIQTGESGYVLYTLRIESQ